jgi:hypothetical protein
MTILLPRKRSRRSFLRGTLGAATVGVALPFLDCFLNENGDALAATGTPLPVRFGTWYWGLGLTPGHSIGAKSQTSPGVEYLEESKALIPYKDQINFYSGFNMPLDGRANFTHYSGWVASRTGTAPGFTGDIPAPTLDLLVADAIGGRSRFFTLDLTSIGGPSVNYSGRSTNTRGLAEASPLQLYSRVFGADFIDPNGGSFKPDPHVMLRQSVLSSVSEDSRKFAATLGASDRARLDEYFTGIRTIENQLALELERPAPNLACVRLSPPEGAAAENVSGGFDVDAVSATHRTMSQMLAMAVACNQTNVFNMIFSDNFSRLRRHGETYDHHLLTHEETIDEKLGYQPLSFYFGQRSMEALATFIGAFAAIKEGAGTLLDNTLIYAGSETNYARLHSLDGLPMFTAGKAGGRLRTGYHVAGRGDPVTSVGLTAMQAMGLSIETWGTRSLQSSKSITDILV